MWMERSVCVTSANVSPLTGFFLAIAFAYFESLLKSGSKSMFLEEETRLKSLTNLMNIAGYDKWSYEDFADQTYDLLRKYMGKVGDPNAEALLTADFNDEGIQNCIITHFKVSWHVLSSRLLFS